MGFKVRQDQGGVSAPKAETVVECIGEVRVLLSLSMKYVLETL